MAAPPAKSMLDPFPHWHETIADPVLPVLVDSTVQIPKKMPKVPKAQAMKTAMEKIVQKARPVRRTCATVPIPKKMPKVRKAQAMKPAMEKMVQKAFEMHKCKSPELEADNADEVFAKSEPELEAAAKYEAFWTPAVTDPYI